jgi:hypothetical protein
MVKVLIKAVCKAVQQGLQAVDVDKGLRVPTRRGPEDSLRTIALHHSYSGFAGTKSRLKIIGNLFD